MVEEPPFYIMFKGPKIIKTVAITINQMPFTINKLLNYFMYSPNFLWHWGILEQ